MASVVVKVEAEHVMPVPTLRLFLALCLDNIPSLRSIKHCTSHILNREVPVCAIYWVIILHRPQAWK